jgi:hypothetical protein
MPFSGGIRRRSRPIAWKGSFEREVREARGGRRTPQPGCGGTACPVVPSQPRPDATPRFTGRATRALGAHFLRSTACTILRRSRNARFLGLLPRRPFLASAVRRAGCGIAPGGFDRRPRHDRQADYDGEETVRSIRAPRLCRFPARRGPMRSNPIDIRDAAEILGERLTPETLDKSAALYEHSTLQLGPRMGHRLLR